MPSSLTALQPLSDSLVSSSLALLLVLQAACAGNDAVQLYIETYAFL